MESGRLPEAGWRPAGRPVALLRAAAAGRVGSGPLPEAAGWRPAGRPVALRAVAAGRVGSAGRLQAAGWRPAGRPVALRAAAAGRVGSGRRREAAGWRPAERPALRAAAAGPAGSVQLREVPREAVDREGFAPARVAREGLDRVAFAPRREAAPPGAAVVVEQAARWRAPGGREVRWRRVDVAAGQALRAPARLELGAGRGAVCRLPGAERLAAERLAQGAWRR